MAVGHAPCPPHAGEDGEGVSAGGPEAVGFEEGVPEDGGGAKDAVENGEGMRGRRGEEDEVGGDIVVLLKAAAEDEGVDLVEVGDRLAGAEEGDDGGQFRSWRRRWDRGDRHGLAWPLSAECYNQSVFALVNDTDSFILIMTAAQFFTNPYLNSLIWVNKCMELSHIYIYICIRAKLITVKYYQIFYIYKI